MNILGKIWVLKTSTLRSFILLLQFLHSLLNIIMAGWKWHYHLPKYAILRFRGDFPTAHPEPSLGHQSVRPPFMKDPIFRLPTKCLVRHLGSTDGPRDSRRLKLLVGTNKDRRTSQTGSQTTKLFGWLVGWLVGWYMSGIRLDFPTNELPKSVN